MKFIEVKNSSAINPLNTGMELFHPKYRDLELNEVIKHSNVINEYQPYGYNLFILVRSTGIIHCFN